MRFLKVLVIGMAVLIVAGVAVIIVATVDKAGRGGGPSAAFTPSAIALPGGAEVVETQIGDGRILVRVKLLDGSVRLLVLDSATGRLTGTIDLRAP